MIDYDFMKDDGELRGALGVSEFAFFPGPGLNPFDGSSIAILSP